MKTVRPMAILISLIFIFGLYCQAGPLRDALRNRLQEKKHAEMPLQSIRVNGVDRTYLLHVPKNHRPDTKIPLVISLHGGGGNAAIADKMTGLPEASEKYGFILVTPNGSGPLKNRLLTWNTGNCCGYAHEYNIDDVTFIRALIEKVSADYDVDPKRVYATGMSNGGKMSYRLACRLSDKIAAIAPVVGSMEEPDCNPPSPVSVMAFNGTADEHVRYEGGAPLKKFDRHPRVDNSVAHAINFWKKANACNPEPRRTKNGNITRDDYTQCKSNSSVVLYTIVGGGHAWPGGRKIRKAADTPSGELSATDEMIRFFLAHPKP